MRHPESAQHVLRADEPRHADRVPQRFGSRGRDAAAPVAAVLPAARSHRTLGAGTAGISLTATAMLLGCPRQRPAHLGPITSREPLRH